MRGARSLVMEVRCLRRSCEYLHTALNVFDTDVLHSYSKFYDPVAMKGMPIAVQVVGRRWEEEKVVEMMKVVDGAVGTKGFGMDAWKAL